MNVRHAAINNSIGKDLHALKSKRAKPIIVGINGVDTSGKTKFAEELCRFLCSVGNEVLCVHLDDFHNDAVTRTAGEDEIFAYIDNAFNLALLEDKILKPFHQELNLDVELTLLDLEEDTYSLKKRFTAHAYTILVLEGTLLFREPIDKYFSYRIFLDVSFDEVKRRASIRDIPRFGDGIIQKYEKKYIPIQKWYLAKEKPKERADLVIDNNDFRNPKVMQRMAE